MIEYNDPIKEEVIAAVSRIPVEYNPMGWEKLSEQLDIELPVKTVKSKSIFKSKLNRFGLFGTLIILVLSMTHSSSGNSVSSSNRETESQNNYVLPMSPERIKKLDNEVPREENVIQNFKSPDISDYSSAISINSSKEKEDMTPPNKIDESIKGKIKSSIINVDTLKAKIQPKNKEDSVFIFW